MKPPHLMTLHERENYLFLCLDNANFMARMNREIAESCQYSDPARAARYAELSESWAREVERLKLLPLLRK